MKRLYEVVTSCEVAGRWRKSGDRVELTAAEAKYLAPPLGAILLPVDAEGRKGAEDGRVDRRQRYRRRAT